MRWKKGFHGLCSQKDRGAGRRGDAGTLCRGDAASDSNHHVNNGQYIHMAMEYLPEDFAVGQMRAEYKKSALLHDAVIPSVVQGEEIFVVSLCNAQGSPLRWSNSHGPKRNRIEDKTCWNSGKYRN